MAQQDLPMLTPREPTAHKGKFGHALLIGGATGMTGAIAIAGMACLRTGAGLVTLAVPQNSHAIVASLDPNYMTLPLPCDASGRLISVAKSVLSDHLKRASCVAIGPGLGRSEASDEIVTDLFENLQGTPPTRNKLTATVVDTAKMHSIHRLFSLHHTLTSN